MASFLNRSQGTQCLLSAEKGKIYTKSIKMQNNLAILCMHYRVFLNKQASGQIENNGIESAYYKSTGLQPLDHGLNE